MPVRILVADDHEVVRQGIRTILSARPDWEICGEAVNGQEAIKLADDHGHHHAGDERPGSRATN
jgi:DNA-binding NarL/FixJ family response regulator